MPDSVTVNVLTPTMSRQTVVGVHMTNVSDSTGESAVKKIDIATLLNTAGVKPDGLRFTSCRWAMQGFTSVTLLWDRTAANITVARLSGNGFDDLRGFSISPNFTKLTGDIDPSEGNADGKGSILLTSVGAVAGATYDITLWCELAQNETAT